MRAQGARCVACKRTLRMQQQSARAAISADSVRGAQRATCRPGHCLTHARCALRHESARCSVVACKQTLRIRQQSA
eukprot:5540155-Pleurochrysis_carterae.AAC.1